MKLGGLGSRDNSQGTLKMKKTTVFLGLLALTFGLALDSAAHAQSLGSGHRGRGLNSFGGFVGTSFSTVWDLYLRGDIPIPPYFALHPPVYYSAPVPRTYGYSPFAYPPSVMTPEIVDAQPIELTNPHVPASAIDPSEDNDKTTQTEYGSLPLAIINPYASTRLAESPGSIAQKGR